MSTALALFTYNRFIHTQQTINALQRNYGANEYDLYIFSDGAKNEVDVEAISNLRCFCENIEGFKSVKLIKRDENYGLSKNIIEGVTYLFKHTERVIVLEDDLITSPGFLKYMHYTLDYYENTDVFSVCGYHPPIKIPKDYPYSTYLIQRIGSWGWGTWKSKWETTDWTVKDFDSFIRSRSERKAFKVAGNDTTFMLLKQRLGINNSWAIRFNYASYKQHGFCVYPVQSLVKNIGIDGTGTHMKHSKKYHSQTIQEIDLSKVCPVKFFDEFICRRFRKFYNTSIYRKMLNYILLKKYLINCH